MPSTPLRSANDSPAPAAGELSAGAADTERPPPAGSFGVEPPSGIEPTRIGPPPDPAKLAELAAAAGPVAAPAMPVAAPAMPVAPGAPAGVAGALPKARPRVPTMVGGAGGAEVERPVTVPLPLAPQAFPRRASPPEVAVPLAVAEPARGRRCATCNELYPIDFLVCPRDATPLVDEGGVAVDPLVGKLLGETYQIVRVVGEGGMGRVYEARHLRLKERRFAVKTLHAELATNHEMAARFMREAESASSIAHPHVVDVFDVHHLPDGTPYLVGEFLEGEELADYVKRCGPLEPKMAAAVGRQVANALSAAHARGIVHRDMKPENIFVLKSSIDAVASGEAHALAVKVLDFGISKAGGGQRTHLTRTGVIMGTPSYMSPEQARGRDVDHRADVYSLGAVLYFAITGQRPFDADDPTSTISMVLTQDPQRPREIDARIPEAMELVVQRAMAKDPRDRYQTMADLEKALVALEGGARTAALAVVHGDAPPEVALDASQAQRAFDVAKRMLRGLSTPPPAQSATLARTARPTIVLASGVLALWLVGGTTAALAGLVRVLHDGEITLTECVLLVVGCLFAAMTPIILYVLHVKKTIWPNSVRALQLASDLKRTAGAALVAYGLFAITSRIVYTVFVRSSKPLTSGLWDIGFFALSVVAALTVGGVGPLLRNMRRRRSS